MARIMKLNGKNVSRMYVQNFNEPRVVFFWSNNEAARVLIGKHQYAMI